MASLNPEVISKVNELFGLDRSLLSNPDSSNEIVNKLRNKIDSLRDNFIVSMPLEYKNESEFSKLCSKIDNLSGKYTRLKSDHSKIKSLIDEYKKKAGSSDGPYEEELKKLITKSISVQRYLIYIRTLIQLDGFRLILVNLCFLLINIWSFECY